MSPVAKMGLSAAAGALTASALVVNVYEGRVSVASRAGTVQVAAGEQARSEPGAAQRLADAHPAASRQSRPIEPQEPPPPAALLERDQTQRAQIAALQARVQELEKSGASAKAPPRAEAADDPPGPHGRYRDFTQAELLSMAQRCEVRAQLPPLDREAYRFPPEMAARLHLSDDEQARVAEVVSAVSKDVIAHLRALYIEATGDTAGADSLEPATLNHEIVRKSPPALVVAARARIARERAGLEPPPPDPNSGTIAERYFRWVITVGDSFQRALEPALGAQHAGKVRDNLSSMTFQMDGCTK